MVGDDVTVGGEVVDGTVVERWREPAPDRRSKRWLGIGGLLVTLVLVITQVRWSGSGFALRG
jgi:hypothetical protein